MNLKKLIVVSIVLTIALQCQIALAQLKIFNLKINTSLTHAEPLKYNGEIVRMNLKPQVGLSLGYEFLANFDAGIYLAYSNLTHMVEYEVEVVNGRIMSSSSIEIPSQAFYYGIDLNYHLLPLLLKGKNLRFDVYPIASAGFVSRGWTEFDGTEVKVLNYPEYHVGLGLGYRFTKHIGMYAEYTKGHFYNEGKSKGSIGLQVKF